jgi:arylformamidase
MKAIITYNNKDYKIDLAAPIDISMPLRADAAAASAWYCDPVRIEPVVTAHFVGDVNRGGSVNFRNVAFNPHGNGTHTECVGHISKEAYSIHQQMKQSFFLAQVISIEPENINGDAVVTAEQLKAQFRAEEKPQAIILRTLPNLEDKLTTQYSNTNPPYVEADVMNWLYEQGVRHFLIDTPSVDREEDGGDLAAHHAFWNYPLAPRLDATITELIFVPEIVKDSIYFLDLQVAALENDASPSKPLLYSVI